MTVPTDEAGVPIWDRNGLELKAEEVIEFFDPDSLESPSRTMIAAIIERCCDESWLAFDATTDLGTTDSGSRILGEYIFKPPTIRISPQIINTPPEDFTMAHEFGHFVLHRNVDIDFSEYAASGIRDTKRDFTTRKKLLTSPRDWIEWQANYFASALLMPRKTFIDAVVATQKKMRIRRNVGRVVITAGASSMRDFKALLKSLHLIYGSSKSAIRNRLSDLGILEDLRDKSVEHISKLLREG